jgi:tellurite resistance protein TerC
VQDYSNGDRAVGGLGRTVNSKLRFAKRVVVAVVGGTVTLIGVALIVLPGPAFIVIPIGVSILATEFAWARRYLRKARQIAARLNSGARPDG